MESEATILVVDPVESQRASLRETLATGGYTVHETSHPADAVAEAIHIRPHLIVLGPSLSEADETALCRAIRTGGGVTGTPILMMSSAHADSAVLAGLDAGADDYVRFDSAPQLILARVRRLIEYHKMAGLAMLDRQLVQIGRLLAGIVHEIRGPLSVIRGSAELLRLSLQDRPDDSQWVDSILRGSSLLQLRLEHLMGAVRSGPIQMQPLDVSSLLNETVDLFVRGLPPYPRRVVVKCDCPRSLQIQGDAGRLMQVFFDLLTNAYQAITGAGREGRVLVRTDCVREDDRDWVKLEVVDDGPGVPDTYLGRIFEPFFTTREGGSGYGLYLASEIIRDLGGRLGATNNPEGGACFSVLLPLDDPAA
ncbi:sensor histidine kinase [Planctomyces sp. SH-PL62]|uniref:sensor histidine kinase n=1 Tax=Planctomyces sp. SH-PL62 TaxID=1636152 RepID=UPI00078D9BDA|nr:ATP-binding protein [Planctomyces sp. SH-PL62]AMV37003.1 Sporulation kinase A [Planctomyces sp. SH-PL62]